jgi:hypothetical protein
VPAVSNRVRWVAATRTFRALDLVFDIRTTDAPLAAFLDHAFGTLPEADPGDPGRVRFGIAAVPDPHPGVPGPRHRLYRRGRAVDEVADAGQALSRLLSLVNDAVVRASGRRRVLVHAALVADAHASTVLAGPSGSGKSTLSALLVAGGARHGTDEVLAVDPATGAIDCFRRPVVLKPVVLVTLATSLPPLDDEVRTYLSMNRPVPVVDLGTAGPDPMPAVRSVVFPEYRRQGPASWEDLSRAESLARLHRSSWYPKVHGRHGFRALAGVVGGAARCGVLRYSDAEEAVALLRSPAAAGPGG